MGWAAVGALLAAGGYALLFPPFSSPSRMLTLLGLLALTLLIFCARGSRRGAR